MNYQSCVGFVTNCISLLLIIIMTYIDTNIQKKKKKKNELRVQSDSNMFDVTVSEPLD